MESYLNFVRNTRSNSYLLNEYNEYEATPRAENEIKKNNRNIEIPTALVDDGNKIFNGVSIELVMRDEINGALHLSNVKRAAKFEAIT